MNPPGSWSRTSYELQIGASRLGFTGWTGDREALRAVAARTQVVLERGWRG